MKSNTRPRILYKYRGFSNLQHALDIFVNKRLFAADFKSLNDPMEGHYTYENGTLQGWQIETIFGEKNRHRIVALSETPNNMLMWSYYGESHSGMVVGVEVKDEAAEWEPIDYVDNLAIELQHENLAKRILSKKYTIWRHEQEQRVFILDRSFVRITPRELIFGISTKPDTIEFISKVAKKFCPRIRISTMTRGQLDLSGAIGAAQQEASLNEPASAAERGR